LDTTRALRFGSHVFDVQRFGSHALSRGVGTAGGHRAFIPHGARQRRFNRESSFLVRQRLARRTASRRRSSPLWGRSHTPSRRQKGEALDAWIGCGSRRRRDIRYGDRRNDFDCAGRSSSATGSPRGPSRAARGGVHGLLCGRGGVIPGSGPRIARHHMLGQASSAPWRPRTPPTSQYVRGLLRRLHRRGRDSGATR